VSARSVAAWGCGGVVVVAMAVPLVGGAWVWSVGSAMPVRTEGASSRVMPAPPEVVWATISEPARVTMSEHATVAPLPADPLPSWEEDLGETRLIVRTESVGPGMTIVRSARDTSLPMTLTLTATVHPEGAHARVETIATLDIEDGTWHVPVFRALVRATGAAQTAQESWLQRVEAALPAQPTEVSP
jgi:hypothetical protein